MVSFTHFHLRGWPAALVAPLAGLVPLTLIGGDAPAWGQATPQTGVAAPPAEPLSNYEVTTAHTLDRDCGFSVPVVSLYDHHPSLQDLWLFCDTVNYDASGAEVGAVLGTDTAAEAPLVPGEVPQDLSELPTPPARPQLPNANAPEPFLPVPSGLVLPGSTSSCVGTGFSPTGAYGPTSPGIYPASWFTGVTRLAPGTGANPLDVLTSFNDYCVDSETGNINTLFTDEAFGLVSYDPLTNRLGGETTVFTSTGGQNIPRQEQLGDPVLSGGYLYLFSSQCLASIFGVCTSGTVYLARVAASPKAWSDPGDYEWWTGNGWSPDYADAVNAIPTATPFGISVGNFSASGHGFVLIAESNVAGAFQVFTAPAPTGPWALLQTDQVPNSSDCNAGEFGCYALVGHPELSTPSELLVSYLDPSGLGHLRLAAFPW